MGVLWFDGRLVSQHPSIVYRSSSSGFDLGVSSFSLLDESRQTFLQVDFLVGVVAQPRACRSLGVGVLLLPCGLLLAWLGFGVKSLGFDHPT